MTRPRAAPRFDPDGDASAVRRAAPHRRAHHRRCRRCPRTASCAASRTSSRGGYAAGYYSYKWAEVLSADAFAAFEEAGLDDPAAIERTGRRFRDTVLGLGGSRHPMEVFEAFRGRAPTTEALLRHSGLLAARTDGRRWSERRGALLTSPASPAPSGRPARGRGCRRRHSPRESCRGSRRPAASPASGSRPRRSGARPASRASYAARMPATSWRSCSSPTSTESTTRRSAFGCGSALRMVPTRRSTRMKSSIVISVVSPLPAVLVGAEAAAVVAFRRSRVPDSCATSAALRGCGQLLAAAGTEAGAAREAHAARGTESAGLVGGARRYGRRRRAR